MSLRAALAICSFLALPAQAQTWMGLTLGAPLPEERAASATQASPELLDAVRRTPGFERFCPHDWPEEAGRALFAITEECDGEVLQIQTSNGFRPDVVFPASIANFRFGRTTRGDIVAHFGHEGMLGAAFGSLRLRYATSLIYEIEDTRALLVLSLRTHENDGISDGVLLPPDEAYLVAAELMQRRVFDAINPNVTLFSPRMQPR